LPGYSADLRRALLEYWLARRNAADANADGWDIAILDRADDGWKVTTDESHANPSVANAVNSDVPLRVGEM
jgi:hypothetical protein